MTSVLRSLVARLVDENASGGSIGAGAFPGAPKVGVRKAKKLTGAKAIKFHEDGGAEPAQAKSKKYPAPGSDVRSTPGWYEGSRVVILAGNMEKLGDLMVDESRSGNNTGRYGCDGSMWPIGMIEHIFFLRPPRQ